MKRWGITVARFGMLGVGSIFLYYGAGFLLLVPGIPGEPYFVKERWVYGVLPLAVGTLIVIASALLAASQPPGRKIPSTIPKLSGFRGALRQSFAYAGVGIVMVLLVVLGVDAIRVKFQPKVPPAFTKSIPGAAPLRVNFLNPSRSHMIVEVRLGLGDCASDPVMHTQRVNGDTGWVLAVSALPKDHLCWRAASLTDGREGAWGEWQVLARSDPSRLENETYEVTLP
jgi:hypothetical protein